MLIIQKYQNSLWKYWRKKPNNTLIDSIIFDLTFADNAKAKGTKRSRKRSSTFEQSEYFFLRNLVIPLMKCY